jgi:hypothetical protein
MIAPVLVSRKLGEGRFQLIPCLSFFLHVGEGEYGRSVKYQANILYSGRSAKAANLTLLPRCLGK